ncbi:MAG TPA: 50S ribosomal protein L10 [Candidatus Paceibacterota bacterium]|nr:50S ribosomal protein L10 [Candidatus Paceibacterota bacterium]
MKTKTQKTEELKEGKKLLEKSQVLIFTDFSKVKTADVRNLRQQLKDVQAKYFVIKKRLLNLLLKEQGIEMDVKGLGSQIGTIFSESDIEKSSAPVYKFFYGLGGDSKAARVESVKKIVGAYDLKKKNFMEAEDVVFIGQLPPREALLGQLFGMIAAPISSLLYVLNERVKQTVEKK